MVRRRLLHIVAPALFALVVVMFAVPVLSFAANSDGQETVSGGQCLEPAPVMRRFHMQMLMHDRTATVHQGVRQSGHNLEDCVTCHAVKGEDGKAVTFEDSRHFCSGCHLKVAVSIDCFSCHRSTPSPKDGSSNIGSTTP